MSLFYRDDWLTVYHGDSRTVMAQMDPESVHCVVTSPPYWGLRDYGQPGQLGLEPTPEAYVAALVAVFREVRRVLRRDGTVWLNLGDSYAGTNGWKPSDQQTSTLGPRRDGLSPSNAAFIEKPRRPLDIRSGLKPKDRVMIPARVALALQADGWYLRDEIIWHKPNPMPSSVTDRTTPAHEMVYLLTKSARYWYDADAIATDAIDGGKVRTGPIYGAPASAFGIAKKTGNMADDAVWVTPARSHKRSVWTVATQPYPDAHFATFPEALIEPMVLAGCPDRVCVECGAPWERVVERDVVSVSPSPRYAGNGDRNDSEDGRTERAVRTTGWRPTCTHDAPTRPGTVLDPFAGSGTTGLVAQRLSRRAVLIDLSMDYLAQIMDRNRDIPLGLGA